MNQNGNGINGYHSNNSAPPSSNPYPEYPPVNPPIYQNPMTMRQPQPNMHAMSQNLWSSIMPQNSLPPPQAQQPQPFNPSSWPNQMQHQGFSNAMPTMYNMPFSVQHLLHEAATMVTPVGEEDEPLLIQALLDSQIKRVSYKDALNGLHGRNNHSGSLWKDYYLDHKHRLDDVVVKRSTTLVKTAKKPLPDSFDVDTSPGLPSSQPVSKRRSRHSIQPTSLPKPSTSRRKTINSLTTHTPVFDDRLPPPNAQITIPDPPSRSPTPPTMVIPKGRGNKYTPADKDFFLNFISWRLKCDPTLTRMELCKELELKAPHHTELSWASYWSNNHDVPDKIMATAKGEEFAEDRSDSDEEEQSGIIRKPKYRSDSSSESTSEAEDPGSDDEQDCDGEASSADERDMGPSGGPFTTADLRVTAKHVASIPDFDNASFQEKWEYFQKRYPQRSAKSWAEYYRTREDTINRLAKKYRKQRQATEVHGRSSIHSQRGRPSWASSSDVGGTNPPKTKRKFTTSDDEQVESNRKRNWDEEDEDGEYEEDSARYMVQH